MRRKEQEFKEQDFFKKPDEIQKWLSQNRLKKTPQPPNTPHSFPECPKTSNNKTKRCTTPTVSSVNPQKNISLWWEKLTPDQKKAIQAYTYCPDINSALRKARYGYPNRKPLTKEQAQQSKNIFDALNKADPYHGTVYRYATDSWMKQQALSKTVTFTSATTTNLLEEFDILSDLANYNSLAEEKNVIYELVIEGVKGADVSAKSCHPGEKEILLQVGMECIKVRTRVIQGVQVITLRCVPRQKGASQK